MPASADLALVCHPSSPEPAVHALAAGARLLPDGGLALVWRLDADLAALRIPSAAYREFNFSPNGQWMHFDFCGHRLRVESPPLPAPPIDVRRGDGWLALRVCLAPRHLPAGALCVGLTAVVEAADGRHSYWSLRHPAGQPDFHHREGFALALRVPTP